MAVVSTAKSAKFGLKLNKGTNAETGNMISGTMTVSGLRQGADNQKVYNVATLMASCLAYPVTEVTKTEVVTLEAED